MSVRKKTDYVLAGGLAEEQLARIHESALTILKEVGISVPHEGVLELLAKCRGVNTRGTRVKYEPKTVNDCVQRIICGLNDNQTEVENEEVGELRASTGGITLNILDMDSGQIRRGVTKDLTDMVKLADSFGMGGAAPVIPQDIPPQLQNLAVNRICWENSKHIGGSRIFPEDAEYLYRMSQVTGKPFTITLWVNSPLVMNKVNLEVTLKFLNRRVPMRVGVMPMMGVTAPIFFCAAVSQLVAETLGAATTLSLISKGGDVHFDFGSASLFPFDMKYGNCVFGSPEHNLMNLVGMQLSRYYGLPMGSVRALVSMGKEPNGEAAAERAMGVLTAALFGARQFFSAGRICMDDVFSGEQLVIDNEIINYVSRFLKGFESTDEKACLEIIKDVGPGGNYLTHKSTLENYRRVYWIPELFDYCKLGRWRAQGSESIRRKAREIAKERIAKHSFSLSEKVKTELDRIFRDACRTLA